jgi:predicted DNA-binding transcriptional regulator AlpA
MRASAVTAAGLVPGERFLTVGQVANRLGVSVRHVWRLARSKPGFPRPVHLTRRVARWRETELVAWMAAKKDWTATPELPESSP